ncbi:MAG: ABC transporter ATP-binding protein, partial [Rhodobacter sp.]|nr:ABC transporter ATP-binding protein [Rhodobacter sp.]
SKTYPTGLTAIAQLDLDIRPGEFLTLLGPSGSGKTTALNLLAGFQSPTTGQILVDGKDIGALPPYKRDIGVVFQHYALFPHMTVRENTGYPLKQRRMPKDEIARRVDDVLRMVALEAYGDRLPRQLSGGQQQRVAVARAIVFRPRLLLMDEPLGALDRKLRESVQLELKRIHRDLGVTIVFVTHDQEEALVMSDRIAIFDQGRIRQIGTASALYDAPVSQFVAQFLGESNCLVGKVDHLPRLSRVTTAAGVFHGVTSDATPQHGTAAVVTRPERCRLFTAQSEVPEGWNQVPARIRDVVYLGALRKVVADLRDGGTFTVIFQPDQILPAAPDVLVAFPPDAARVVLADGPKNH